MNHNFSAHAWSQSYYRGTMAADSTVLQSLVEEFVSGLQDSKAKDTATGKQNTRYHIFLNVPPEQLEVN